VSVNGSRIDFRPSAPARYEVRFLGESLRAIRDELEVMAPHRVEKTGGFLWAWGS
jgi:hypothetical protein